MSKDNLNFFQVSEVKLSYISKVNPQNRPKVCLSQNAYDIFMQMWSDSICHVEEFNMLLLNRSNNVLGFMNVSKGGLNGTVVDARVIFSAAILANASGIVLAHNHPSGNLKPSRADIDITKKLKDGGKLLDVLVLDHLIVSPSGYYSFADEGMI